MDIGEGKGKPSSILNGGNYEDVYVRTAEGWRIKSRQFLPSQSGEQPNAAIQPARMLVNVAKDPGLQPRPKGATAVLGAEDYVEIQQLVSSYPFALDTGADSGAMYADLFSVDGTFVAGDTKVEGRDKLKAFAFRHRPGQGPLYVGTSAPIR